MARKRLGDAIKVLGRVPMTGAQAVAAVTGAPPDEDIWRVTTVRFRKEQLEELRVAAARRADTKAGGLGDPRRSDASAIIREAVDEWLAKHRSAKR